MTTPPHERTRIEEIQDMLAPFGAEDDLGPREDALQRAARGAAIANGLIRDWRDRAREDTEADQTYLARAETELADALSSLQRARTL
ncbi:hypothetical protein [Nocardiopsis synnemataformans]|uniref:hypothetical protein n=1 Tax=Nocardiopsis synnemataformans TaxID=61305 RepID=UPI003EBDBC8A